VVYRSHFKRPQIPPKVDFGGPNYRLRESHVASHVDWPSRTLLTLRPARQDAVLLRRMTTTRRSNLMLQHLWNVISLHLCTTLVISLQSKVVCYGQGRT